jgi:tetratricopeptide (TPR) repeat protein
VLHNRFKEKLEGLLGHIKRDLESRRYSAYMVRLNSPVARLKTIAQLSQMGQEAKVVAREIYLSSRLAIMPQLERELQRVRGKVDVICVNGFDTAAQESPAADHIVLLFDQFAKDIVRLPLPVVFWLPTFIVDLAYNKVPAFWRLVEGKIFDFRADPHLLHEAEHNSSGIQETPEARQKRIERLEEQVEDIRQLAGRISSEHAPILLVLAHSYFDDRQYEKAYEAYSEVLVQLDATSNAVSRAAVLQSIGHIYHIWGVYDKALNHYRESFAARRKLGDIEGLAQTTHQLGLLYQDLGEFDKAIDFYRQSIDYFQYSANPAGIADNYLNLGMIHEEVGLHSKAVEKYREAFEFYRQKNQSKQMANSLFYTGRVYFERDLPKEAVKFFITAKAIYESIHSPRQRFVDAYLDDISRILGEQEYERLYEEARRPTQKHKP